MSILSFIFHIFSICIFFSCLSKLVIASNVLRARGVSLEDSPKYAVRENFTCFDGTRTIPYRHVNDDYCDCNDGSDEPGTSACLSKFYCNNKGYIGVYIPSSFVNDNVCDCCDASDEYKSEVECENICLHLAESAKKEAQKYAEMLKEGYSLSVAMCEQGKQLKSVQVVRIEELLREKEQIEADRNEKLVLKERAEEPEKAALEKYKELERQVEEKKRKSEEEQRQGEAKKAFEEFDLNADGLLTRDELVSSQVFDTNRNGEVSQEEAQFHMQDDEFIDFDKFISKTWPIVRQLYVAGKPMFTPPSSNEAPIEEETSKPIQDTETTDVYEDEGDQLQDVDEDYDLDKGDEFSNQESVVDEEDIESSPESYEKPNDEGIQYDPETQELVNAAKEAREAFLTADKRLRDVAQEIEQLKEDLERDYGPEERFRVLKQSCFEYSDQEYIYKLCPFDSVTQRPLTGGSETSLGKWNGWIGPPNNIYSSMKYTGGQGCWNGPQRFTEVRLSCGVKNEVISVSEPNRCEYLFHLTTPAVCPLPSHSSDSNADQHIEL